MARLSTRFLSSHTLPDLRGEKAMSEEEPNYKDSQKIVGQLYPILKSKDGKIIDGFHRQAVDPNWKVLVLPEIDSEEKLLVARAVSNWHRRQVSREEKAEWINGLAAIYKKQGLKIGNGAEHTNQIKQKIMEVTGLAERTVSHYLRIEFKQPDRAPHDQPQIPAIERVENVLGPEVVKRLRKEIKKEEKLSPQEKATLTKERQRKREEREKKKEETKRKREEQYRKKIEEETKQKLLKDKDFLEKASEYIPRIEIPEIQQPKDFEMEEETVEGTQNLEQFLRRYAEALKHNPSPKVEIDEVQTAIVFFKRLLKTKNIICPVCGEQHLQWRCGHEF